jgi:hypothetical protein
MLLLEEYMVHWPAQKTTNDFFNNDLEIIFVLIFFYAKKHWSVFFHYKINLIGPNLKNASI